MDVSRVALAVRPKLVAYQDEAAEALALAFLPQPHRVRSADVFLPGPAPEPMPSSVALSLLVSEAMATGDLRKARGYLSVAIGPALTGSPRERMGLPREELLALRVKRARERVLRTVRAAVEPYGCSALEAAARGRKDDNHTAIRELVAEGVLARRPVGAKVEIVEAASSEGQVIQ